MTQNLHILASAHCKCQFIICMHKMDFVSDLWVNLFSFKIWQFCLLFEENYKFWHVTYSAPMIFLFPFFVSAYGNFGPQLNESLEIVRWNPLSYFSMWEKKTHFSLYKNGYINSDKSACFLSQFFKFTLKVLTCYSEQT